MHGVGDDFNVFGDGANVEYYIVFQLVVYLYLNASFGERPEPRRRDRQLITSGRQRKNAITAIRTGQRFLAEIRVHVGGDDLGSGNHRAAAVVHHSKNRSGHVGA